MSYITCADLNIKAISKENLESAVEEITTILGISDTPFPAEAGEEEKNEWICEATKLIEPTDVVSEETKESLISIGFSFEEENNECESVTEEEPEATEKSEEAEEQQEKSDEKPVKKEKGKRGRPKKDVDPSAEPKAKGKPGRPKKDPSEKKEKAPKEPKEKKPGVIAMLHQYVLDHAESGFTINQAHDHIVSLFPEKNPTSLLATCRVQLQNSRMGRERFLVFTRTKDGEDHIITVRDMNEAEKKEAISTMERLAKEKKEKAPKEPKAPKKEKAEVVQVEIEDEVEDVEETSAE